VTVEALAELLSNRRVAVLTGAGCSTESGIPDYRGAGTARRARNPIQFRAFTASDDARRRYWARSMLGWKRVAHASPNAAHRALAELEKRGAVVGLITQNVDGLHSRAGSQRIVELHGTLDHVGCLDCGALEKRCDLQQRMQELNPRHDHATRELPDGDAELPEAQTRDFVAPSCLACGGPLKPQVVFFGENVPRQRVDDAFELMNESNALLVVGSSLVVFSGFRFVRHAAERGIPIGIVNLGSTRGDPLAAICVDAKAGVALPTLAQLLGPLAGLDGAA
jgi:NAD-dependent deacetylase sirtuin 4